MEEILGNYIHPISKWLHIIAGVMWIGLLYFFNFINGQVAATYNADSKKLVVPELMPRTLYWFRWGAAWTWFTGIILMYAIFWSNETSLFSSDALPDELTESTGNNLRHLAYLIPFVMVFAYDIFYKSKIVKNVRISTIISYVSIIGVIFFLHCVTGMTEYRAINIHIGAMFGSMMAFNVWFRIWPAQKQIITAIKNGEAPDSDLVALAGLRSKHNTYLSVPLIWTMINQHTVGFSGLIDRLCGCDQTALDTTISATPKYDWVILMLVIAIGWHLVYQLYKKSGKIKGF